jgi:hypothetical protein
VPRSDDAPCEYPRQLDLCFVLHRPVTPGHIQFLHRRRVGIEFIGDNHVHSGAGVLPDVLCERSNLGILSMKEPKVAAALSDTDCDFFSAPSVPPGLS